ncbi:MAG: arginase family protein [Proteobacteria bacterium]|nr:arginase family protein [Pseudomonadota bacterium]
MSALQGCALISLPFARDFSFRTGASQAPELILNELAWLDTWEWELGRDPFATVPRISVVAHDAALTDVRIQSRIAELAVVNCLDASFFPLSLGGDRIASLGPVRAVASRGPIGLVSLSARADISDAKDGDTWHAACALRHLNDCAAQTMLVGVQAINTATQQRLARADIQTIAMGEAVSSDAWHAAMASLPERVYLTVDMNVFDPAEVPASARPTSAGLPWDAVVRFLRALFRQRQVVGADVMGLAAGSGDAVSVRAAARLVSLMVGLRFPQAPAPRTET